MSVPALSREMEERATALHREAFVFDGSCPSRGLFVDEEDELRAILDGGINGTILTLANANHDYIRAMESISEFKKLVSRRSETLRFCTTAAELEHCKQEGKVGMIIEFQETKPILDNLDNLNIFYDLGLRVLQLSYNNQGYVGTGCCERHDAGLSEFGLEVVAECNRLGILIDLSHCGHGTSWDAIKHSRAPVAATHSGVYSLCPAYGRNKPDDLMKAIADTGGMLGIPCWPPLVKRNPTTHQVLQGSVDDILNHMEYAIKVMGIDHVGLGSDLCDLHARTRIAPPRSSILNRVKRPDVFGAGSTERLEPYPVGMDSKAKTPNLTTGLVQRGYKDEEIKKLMGGNWLRLFTEVLH